MTDAPEDSWPGYANLADFFAFRCPKGTAPHRERITGMSPIPLEALLAIYAFAFVVSYGKWRWALKGAGWTNGEKRIQWCSLQRSSWELPLLTLSTTTNLGSDNSELVSLDIRVDGRGRLNP
jgi:hypothetical protein